MTFIIHFKDGHRETYSNHYDENDDPERDAAWDDVYRTFPNADYIEEFYKILKKMNKIRIKNEL